MTNTRRIRPVRASLTFAAGFACGSLAFAAFAAALAPAPEPAPPAEDAPVLAPCEHEDSTDCFWDAGESGNGEGVSFVDIDGTAYYAEEPEPVEVPAEEPAAPAEEPAAPAPAPQQPTWDEGTLECGQHAGVAVDQDADGSNWAYCEPGMID